MVRAKRGTGLLPHFDRPVLFIGQLEECRGIRITGDHIRIGAAATLSELADDRRVPQILRMAADSIAGPAIRNTATIGGNICNASPAGDTLPPLYIMDATLTLRRFDGEREVPLATFILGPGNTDLRADEIVTSVNIPVEKTTAFRYRKVATRRAVALAKVSFAASAQVDGGFIRDIRIALGAVGPVVVRSRRLEKTLIGRNRDMIEEIIPGLLDGYREAVHPIDDQRSTAEYRREVSLRLVRRFITEEAWK